ncbi:MAG: HDIG domain-containing protein [Deltaproteobacteria bacterium]|nr:HDIG domain-containing protein [Deltaproteobacteria bacterium]
MNPRELLKKYAPEDDRGRRLLITHSEAVARFSLQVAQWVPALTPDLEFIEEAALLHDIGVVWTHAPTIGCTGSEPYMKHGLLGAELLLRLGFPRHARVCECHIGVGLTREDILAQNLPLPPKDIVPETIEEQIIAYVDNFFSKSTPVPEMPNHHDMVRAKMASFGERCLATFDAWAARFGPVEG